MINKELLNKMRRKIWVKVDKVQFRVSEITLELILLITKEPHGNWLEHQRLI